MFSAKRAFSLAFFVIIFTACATQGKFGPVVDVVSPAVSGTYIGPVEIDFVTLSENPAGYQNQLVQISGRYKLFEQDSPPVFCPNRKGPHLTWSLQGDGKHLNIAGFDQLVDLAPVGAAITVEGVWKRYEGPAGCGKEPADQVVWYLMVSRIIEPNPLLFVDTNVVVNIEPQSGGEIAPEQPQNNESPPEIIEPTPVPVIPTSTPIVVEEPEEVVNIYLTEEAFNLTATAVSIDVGLGETPTPSLTPTPDVNAPIVTRDDGFGAAEATPTFTPTDSIPTRSDNTVTETPTPSATPTLTSEQQATVDAGGSEEIGIGLGSGSTNDVTQTPLAPTVTPTSSGYNNSGGYDG